MDAFRIHGGGKLSGEVRISGAKNSALPILAATLLTGERSTIHNLPKVNDIRTMLKLMRHFGTQAEGENEITVRTEAIAATDAPYEIVKTMRASSLVLGPLLARTGHASVSLPGGCAIGARPLDLHLAALEKMGADIAIAGGYITATAKKLNGARIHFNPVTVTGTENIMMAACLADGTTVIENAAREPEIGDLGAYLTKMGGRIRGLGTPHIEIEGVAELHGADHTIISDRIEAGTFMMAAAITGSRFRIAPCTLDLLSALADKLEQAGVGFQWDAEGVVVSGPDRLRAVDVTTSPYPGFATDLQAQFMAGMSVAHGTSTITETIFENRYMHVAELNRLGADISVHDKTAVVNGVMELRGAPVMATDLRASASLVLAALRAVGTTDISRVYHLDRGYEEFDTKLRQLGAAIERLPKKGM